jgi:hypothetical protein
MPTPAILISVRVMSGCGAGGFEQPWPSGARSFEESAQRARKMSCSAHSAGTLTPPIS